MVLYDFAFLIVLHDWDWKDFYERIIVFADCQYAFVYVRVQDTGVGKSSIVCRFVQDHFDHNISPTIGWDHSQENTNSIAACVIQL